jgi:hypothetical protein
MRDAAVLQQVPLGALHSALDLGRLLVSPRAGPQCPSRGSLKVALVLGHPMLEQLALLAVLGHPLPLTASNVGPAGPRSGTAITSVDLSPDDLRIVRVLARTGGV